MIRENIAMLRAVELPEVGALTERITEMEQGVNELPLRVEMQMAKLKQKVAPVPDDQAAADGQ